MTYKKVPSICSKERRDVYKHTGQEEPRDIIFYVTGKKGMEEFDNAVKALAIKQGCTINNK